MARNPKTPQEVEAALRELLEFKDSFSQRDFAEANAEIRRLIQFREDFTLRNVNWNQRRIVNAHPSVDLYDYVVRKELVDTFGDFKTPRATRGAAVVAANYDKITFGVGVGAPVVAGDYVTPPYVWSNIRQGRPVYGAILANIPPTGTDIRFLVKKNDVSIFSGPYFSFPAGTAARQVVLFSGDLIATVISRGDVVTPHILQIGSLLAGQDITITIYCNLL